MEQRTLKPSRLILDRRRARCVPRRRPESHPRRDVAPVRSFNQAATDTALRAPEFVRRRLRVVLLAAPVAIVILLQPPGPAPALAAQAAPSGGAPPHSADLQRMPGDYLMPILGKDVVSATGEKMGPIVDVLFDGTGKPRAAVIDFGGFLGVGTSQNCDRMGRLAV